jgi:hypothetical protein
MPVDDITDATENILRASQLQQPMRDSLKAQFEKATQALGTPGFHRFDDIDTLVGLGGQFLWPEDPFAVRMITLTFDTGKVGVQGRYKIVSGVFTVEEGVFFSVPNNPAIGFAFLTLTPQGGPAPRTFFFAGIFIDLAERIVIAMLNKLGPNGPIQPPFSAVRIS